MIRAAVILAAIAGMLSLTPDLSAQSITYSVLLSGPSESPPNASPGTGFGTVIVDTTAHTLEIHVTFSGLTGTTTAAHIHSATAFPLTGTAMVATTTPSFSGFPLFVTAGAFDNTLDMTLASSYNAAFITANGGTTASAEAALAAGIANGNAYFNIHSSTFPGGEIRGFLVAVPEPATIAMIGVAVGGAGLVALRRRMKNRDVRFARK